MKYRPTTRPGAAALVMVVVMSAVGLAIMTTVLGSSNGLFSRGRSIADSAQTFYWAESGLNQVVYAMVTAADPTTVGDATFNPDANTTVVVTVPSGSFPKTLLATATNSATDVERKVQITIHASSTGGASGAVNSNGEFNLDNGATVTGPVHTNGDINGANNSVINGDVVVGGAANRLSGGKVLGNVQSYTIANEAKICGNAIYHTIDSGNNSSLDFLMNPSAPTCPNPLTPGTGTVTNTAPTFPVFPNPDTEQFITDVKAAAEAGGPHLASLTIGNNATESLGPKVIDGDLVLNNNSTLLLTGPLWVKGNITFSNPGGVIRIDPARGAANDTIIADGNISVKNNGTFAGSGHTTAGKSDSYLMVASRSSSVAPGNAALDLSNNVDSVIFYVPFGLAKLQNVSNLNNVTAKTVSLANGTIVYDPAIEDLLFTGVTTKYFTVDKNSWTEQ